MRGSHGGPLEPSDLQTVMPPLNVFSTSSTLRHRSYHSNNKAIHIHQSNSSNTTHTGSFRFFEAWPSPSSIATVGVDDVFRFELIPNDWRLPYCLTKSTRPKSGSTHLYLMLPSNTSLFGYQVSDRGKLRRMVGSRCGTSVN